MSEAVITNLRCLNPKCTMTFDYTKSEWEDPNLKCYICQTSQHGLWYDCGHVHKNITEALNCKRNEPTTPHTTPGALAPGQMPKLHRSPTANPKEQIGLTKLPLRLIPPSALAHLARALYDGAITKGYGPLNWRETEVNLTTYLEAALRHIFSILDGEDIDKSGCHHAAHAMACMAIILDAMELDKLIDDRLTPGNFAQLVTKFQEKLPTPHTY